MDRAIKDNNLYAHFLEYSYKELNELFKKAKTKEEQDFYMTLSNIVLQREQEKVIMNLVRKVANSDILASIIDIPESLKNKKVEILILPFEENEENFKNQVQKRKAKASLKAYGNANLLPNEETSWQEAMVEKHENR